MKLKLKFDKKTILAFLLENVEKIVLGAVVLIFLMMLYSSLTGAGRFDRTPEQLQTQAANGKRDLDSTPPASGLAVLDYADQAKRSRLHIEEKPYENRVLWDTPVFSKKPPRDAPPLFAVQQLRGTAGVGAFQVATVATPEARPERPEGRRTRPGATPPADVARESTLETVRGQRWIVITGLVPMEKQEAAYAETFKQSVFYDPQKDYPTYLGFWVERVEVASAGDAASPNWDKAKKFMSKEAIEAAMEQWPQSRDVEVVGTEYIEPKLAFPLGPRVNQLWGPEVAHEPQIPVKNANERDRGMGMGPGMGMNERGPLPDRVRRDNRRMPPMVGPGPGMGPGRDGRERVEDDTPFSDTAPEPKPDESAKPEQAETKPVDEENKVPEYRLFRFFDFSVEPGKQYVYRVCLALQNPNRDLKQTLLMKPELATEKFLKTKWSEPSPAITVPRDSRILALSVTPPRPNVDPSCKVLVAKWLINKGIEAFVEKSKIGRGQVADYPGEKFRPAGAAAHRSRFDGRNPGYATSSGELTVDFITGITVVDFRRGNTSSAAGEILLLNPDGTLNVCNELDDTPEYEQLTIADTTEVSPEPMGVPGPGFMGPPGPGMGPRPRTGLDSLEDNTRARKRPATKK